MVQQVGNNLSNQDRSCEAEVVIEAILIFFSISLLIGIQASILHKDSTSWPPSFQAARTKNP